MFKFISKMFTRRWKASDVKLQSLETYVQRRVQLELYNADVQEAYRNLVRTRYASLNRKPLWMWEV